MASLRLFTWLHWVEKKCREATPENKPEALRAIIGTASFAAVKSDTVIPEQSVLGELRDEYRDFRPHMNRQFKAVDDLLAFAIFHLHEDEPDNAIKLCDELLALPISGGLTARLQFLQHGFGVLNQRMEPAAKDRMLQDAGDIITELQCSPVRGTALRVLRAVHGAETALAA